MNFNDSWGASIDKLMFWRAGTWVKHDIKSANLYLRIYGDQLLITADRVVLETLNMQYKIKGIYKKDILILIVTDYTTKNVRKIQFQIQSNPAQCYKMLGEHFPVFQYNSSHCDNMNFRYRNTKVVLKAALETEGQKRQGPEIPEEFKHFVKLCLLDPTFPNFVHETKNVLQAAELL